MLGLLAEAARLVPDPSSPLLITHTVGPILRQWHPIHTILKNRFAPPSDCVRSSNRVAATTMNSLSSSCEFLHLLNGASHAD